MNSLGGVLKSLDCIGWICEDISTPKRIHDLPDHTVGMRDHERAAGGFNGHQNQRTAQWRGTWVEPLSGSRDVSAYRTLRRQGPPTDYRAFPNWSVNVHAQNQI